MIKKTNILLVNPPVDNILKIGVDSEFLNLIGQFPPMGLLYIATVVKNKGYNVKIVDCPSENISHENLAKIAYDFKPDIIGITTYTVLMTDVLLFASNAKKIMPNVKIILGGHHIYTYPELSINYKEIDFILHGEADFTFTELVEGISNNVSVYELKKIKGIGFIESGKAYFNHANNYVKNLDEIPVPDRSMLNMNVYKSLFDSDLPEVSIYSSRGCPFNCSFCLCPEKVYRSRSVENIMLEIKQLYNLGHRRFYFFDELFSSNSYKVIDLSNAIISEGLIIKWSYRTRVNSVDDEVLKIAKKAGLNRLQFGIESFNKEVLEKCNKKITQAQVFNVIELCKKNNIISLGNLMIGLPGQTKEVILNDIKLSIKKGLDFAEFNLFTPLPNTQIYIEALKNKQIPYDFWLKYSISPISEHDNFYMYYYTADVDKKTQFKLCKKAFIRFYFRPRFIINRLKKLTSMREFILFSILSIKLIFFRVYTKKQ